MVLVVCIAPLKTYAAPLEAPCVALFRQKQLPQAARCFQSKIKRLPVSKRSYRGRLARNAAVVWQRAAKASPGQATAYLQQAILLYQSIYREKLCLDASGCATAQSTYKKLCTQVGCSQIQISVSPSTSQVQVLAQSIKLPAQQGGWTGQLPPGSYQIKVKADGYTSKTHPLYVFARRDQKVSVTLPPPTRRPIQRLVRRTPPPQGGSAPRPIARATPGRPTPPPPKGGVPAIAWVGYVGGAILLAAGGGLLAAGYGGRAAFVDRWNDPAQEIGTKERDDTLSSTQGMAIGGWIALGTGGALLFTGIFTHALSPAPTPTTR